MLAAAAGVIVAGARGGTSARIVIKTKPAGVIARTSATFLFTTGRQGHDSGPSGRAAFQCRLDLRPWVKCRSPKRYTRLRQGRHRFAVRLDPRLRRSLRPATASWRVDTVAPPAPSIRRGPGDSVAGTTASFVFTEALRVARTSCAVDARKFARCVSPFRVANTPGLHVFKVVAIDTAGNRSARKTRRWFVSSAAAPPTTTTVAPPPPPAAPAAVPAPSPAPSSPGPAPSPADTTPPPVPTIDGRTLDAAGVEGTFTFADSETSVTFACSLDSGASQACTSPHSVGPVAAGPHTFAVSALDSAGNRSAAATSTWTTGATIAAAGDIACAPDDPDYNGGVGTGTFCEQQATADVIAGISHLDGLLPLGDEQYQCGDPAEFSAVYALTWGSFDSIAHPVPGNHEYGDTANCSPSNAAGYYGYYGAAAGDPTKGYYSYDLGAWHLIAINSNCAAIGGCGAGSAEETWLAADLAADTATCTLAYWHHPRFSAGQTGDDTRTAALWTDLVNAHADLVLNGHDHTYQRFTQMDASGMASPDGVRELIVGTGGEEHHTTPLPRSALEVSDDTTFGVLKLILMPDGYSGQFLPAAGTGTFTDSFTGTCS